MTTSPASRGIAEAMDAIVHRPYTGWERIKLAFAVLQIGACLLEIYRIAERRRAD